MSIRRNTAYNLLGSIIPLAVSFLTIPIYIRLVGEARYGVLAIAWLLLGYFGLFDLGLGRATAQRIAALRNAATAARARAFWTALITNLGLGSVGGLLIWPVAAYFFGNLLKIEDALRPEVQAAVPWLILAVPVATTSGVLSGALQGRERFLELNSISVTGTLLFQLLPLAAALIWKPDLNVLLPAALGARLLTLPVLLHYCRRHIFLAHGPSFAPEQAGQLLHFGGWITVTAFVGPMMVILDRFLIGAMAGAKAVAYYSVPFQLAQRSTVVAAALAASLFPRFAAVAPEERARLAAEGLQALAAVITPPVAVGILLMEPFLAWWLTPGFARQSTLVGQIILLSFWVNSFARIPYVQLQASGRPDRVAKCHLAEVLPYFGLLYLGLSIYGLVGAALAFCLRVLTDLALLAGLAGILSLSLRTLIMPGFLLALAWGIATQTEAGGTGWYLLVGLHQLITLAWAWRRAPPSVRRLIRDRLARLTG